jgi:hypothetical protein
MSWRGKQHVYFAAACGKIKIGCSNNPSGRLVTVGEWVPFPITLMATMPGAYDVESAIHRMFDAEWSHGEWFDASPRLLAFIADIAEGKPVVIDTDAIATRRRAFIADKKRISHRLNRLRKVGAKLPDEMHEQLSAVRSGQPIPPPLLTEVNSFIDQALAA